MDKANLKI